MLSLFTDLGGIEEAVERAAVVSRHRDLRARVRALREKNMKKKERGPELPSFNPSTAVVLHRPWERGGCPRDLLRIERSGIGEREEERDAVDLAGRAEHGFLVHHARFKLVSMI